MDGKMNGWMLDRCVDGRADGQLAPPRAAISFTASSTQTVTTIQ